VPSLVVVPRSDSFADLWAELAAEVGADLRLVDAPGELAPDAAMLAVVLAVAGVEEEAEPLLRSCAAAGLTGPLLVGARADHRLAITLLRAGAADYFALPPEHEALRTELRGRRRRYDAALAGRRLAEAERTTYDFSRIIGRSPALRLALDRAARIIPRDRATVLISGETGTGKELLARAIHFNGPRATAPFVEVNCAAIPATLLESELFGHEKGAFTDAHAAKPGLFEAAAGGTLFLDEIGHMPLALQGKLLRAIEEKTVRRVGALQPRPLDVRIIAATHVDLAAAVGAGEFREDLFYRLSVIPIHLPPLRERGDDVLMLAEHFLTSLASQYGVPAPALSLEIRRILLAHRWPGNVRELRNSLERALLLGDDLLDRAVLFPETVHPHGDADGVLPFPATLEEIERRAASEMTRRHKGNKSAAAQALGISRSRLYRLLQPGL
jgi:DNA-binding NtrC family response regulator